MTYVVTTNVGLKTTQHACETENTEHSSTDCTYLIMIVENKEINVRILHLKIYN